MANEAALKVELAFVDTEINSDKVYKLEMTPASGFGQWEVAFLYGRRNGALKGGVKTSRPVSYFAARSIYIALVREKLGKGYRITSLSGGDSEMSGLAADYGVADAARNRAAAAAEAQRKKAEAQASLERLRRNLLPPAQPVPLAVRPRPQAVTVRPSAQSPAPSAFGAAKRRIILEDD